MGKKCNGKIQIIIVILLFTFLSCSFNREMSGETTRVSIDQLPHYTELKTECNNTEGCKEVFKCYSIYLEKLYYGGYDYGTKYLDGSINKTENIDYEKLMYCALELRNSGNIVAHTSLIAFYTQYYNYVKVRDKRNVGGIAANSYVYKVLSKMRGEDVLNIILLWSQDSVCDDGGHGDDYNNRSLDFLKSILPEVVDNIDGQSPNDWVWQRDQYTIDFLDKGVKYGGCREIELELYKYKLKEAQKNNLIDFKKYDSKIY